MIRLTTIAIVWAMSTACHAGMILSFQHGDGGSFSTTDATFVKFRNKDRGFPNQPTFANDNFADELSLEVQHLPTTNRDLTKGIIRTLIRFPDFIGSSAGQVPVGAQISSATLRLTLFDNSSRVSQSFGKFDAFRMIKNWDEETVTWNILNVSPDDYDPTLLDSVNTTGSPLVWDLTSAAQAWANGTPNFGVGIVMDLSDPQKDDKARFYSEDVGTVSWRPRLDVEFEAAANTAALPEPSSFALLALGGLTLLGRSRGRRKT